MGREEKAFQTFHSVWERGSNLEVTGVGRTFQRGRTMQLRKRKSWEERKRLRKDEMLTFSDREEATNCGCKKNSKGGLHNVKMF